MSTMIYRSVLRLHLPYNDASVPEVLSYIKPLVKNLPRGNDTIYWYDGDDDYEDCSSWIFEGKKIRLVHWDDQYSIDLMLSDGEDYYDDYIEWDNLSKLKKSLCKLFDVSSGDVALHNYSWYTGVDEPWRNH